MRKNGQRIALKLLLGGVSLTSICMPQIVMAQDDAADEDAVIIVTGSRVSSAGPVGSTATVLGRDEITSSGAATIDRVIRELPQVFDLGVSENSRAQAGGSGNIVYGNTINLRGIGPYATLVLIDGHRVVNNSRSTDPSVLPTLGVERVEVVANGASAIYGSDAVAGVVNLIPRRSLDGVEAFARYGTSGDGDFDEWSAGVAFGKVFDRGQIMVAYEHVERSNLNGDDRDFFTSDQTPFGGNDYRVTTCAPGTMVIDGTTYALPAQYTQANAGAITAGTANRCNANAGQDLFPQQMYNSVNATASFEPADGLEFFVDGYFSKRKFERQGGVYLANMTVPETNAFFVRPPGFTGSSYALNYSFINELPVNKTSGFAKSWQISPGFSLQLPYDWEFEALVSYGETREFSGAYDNLDSGGLAAALASSDPATAFDPYGLGRTSQSVIDGIFDQVFLAPTNGTLTFYEVGMNGPLFEFPGGEVMLATGYERQIFDVALGLGRGGPGSPISFRNFDRTIDSVYGELLVPLFGPGNATAGFEKLEVTAAVRHDRYSDAGQTTNPQFGVDWTPVHGVKLRGSYGTSFRAPTIPEIHGNSTALFGQLYQNPTGGTPLLGFTFGSGPNLDLGPETATTWSVGADFEPVDGLDISLTYFSVEYQDQITALLSNLAILSSEDQYAGTGVILRDQAARDRVQELLDQGVTVRARPIPGGDVANVNLFVDGRGLNLGQSITRGVDFNIRYPIDFGSSDRLTLSASGTYLTEYKVAVSPSATPIDQLNLIFQPLKFKARVVANWDHGPVTVRASATHVGGYTNNVTTPIESVSSFTPVDLSITWRVGDSFSGSAIGGLELTAEVRNLFDQDPPYVNVAPGNNGSGGYDASSANPIGRQFGASARVRF